MKLLMITLYVTVNESQSILNYFYIYKSMTTKIIFPGFGYTAEHFCSFTKLRLSRIKEHKRETFDADSIIFYHVRGVYIAYDFHYNKFWKSTAPSSVLSQILDCFINDNLTSRTTNSINGAEVSGFNKRTDENLNMVLTKDEIDKVIKMEFSSDDVNKDDKDKNILLFAKCLVEMLINANYDEEKLVDMIVNKYEIMIKNKLGFV